MNKKAKGFLMGALAALMTSSSVFYGCTYENDSSSSLHQHEYAWYVAREATCSVVGIMEGTCETCGEKTFSEIKQLDHNFQEGFCTVCEMGETDNLIKINDPKIGWSFNEIYERSLLLKVFTNKSEFTHNFVGVTLQNFSVTDSGHIKMTLQKNGAEYNATLQNVREDFDMRGEAEGYVSTLAITAAGRLEVTLADGTFEDYGYVAELQSDKPTNAISRILVNFQNEMIFIYTDGTAKRVGAVPSDELNADEGVLVYLKAAGSDTYSIYGALSSDLTAVTIPASHRGKDVTAIRSSAFGDYANLKTVFIPASVTTIGNYAFPKNTKIFTDAISVPSGWSGQVQENCPVYLADEWEWINGVPTPIE